MMPRDLIGKLGPLDDPIVECLKLRMDARLSEVRSCVKEFMMSAEAQFWLENEAGQPGIFIYDSTKPLCGLHAFGFECAEGIKNLLKLKHGDLIIVQARKRERPIGDCTALGSLRLAIHKFVVSKGLIDRPAEWNFLWIHEFPLFTANHNSSANGTASPSLVSTHHPFTAPLTMEDAALLFSNPPLAKADHYDLVLNGIELGGGSKRIHDARVQEYVFRNILRLDDERVAQFSYLLDALRAGCPPHAGIALGFDRLCAEMLRRETIRDVIAFPKNGKAVDMMVGSPSKLADEQLKEYHLRLV